MLVPIIVLCLVLIRDCDLVLKGWTDVQNLAAFFAERYIMRSAMITIEIRMVIWLIFLLES